MLASSDPPRIIRNEIVSALEFEHRTTVHSAVVLTETGRRVAVYDHKETDP